MVLIQQTHFEHPVIKISLLRMMAGRYAELGDLKTAAELIRKAIAAIAGTELAAPASGVPVNLACSLAAYLGDTGDQQAALAELDRADALLAAGAEVSVPSGVSCLEQRGYVEMALGRYDSGVAVFRSALAKLAGAGVREGEQFRVVRSGLSMALMDAGDTAAAMAIARPLLIESEAGQGQRSIAVMNRSAIVTQLTRLGGDPLAALAMSDADRHTAAQVAGADSDRDDLQLEHGRILLELARYPDAIEAFAEAATSAKTQGSTIDILRAGLGETEALLRAGRVSDAEARFTAIAPLRDKAYAPQQIDALRIESMLDAARGKDAAAQTALQAAARLAAPAGKVPHPRAFAIIMLEGERALAAKRADAGALAAAERAIAAARHTALDPARSSDVGRALLLRARLLSIGGQPDRARLDAQAARTELEPTLGDTHPDTLAAIALSSAT